MPRPPAASATKNNQKAAMSAPTKTKANQSEAINPVAALLEGTEARPTLSHDEQIERELSLANFISSQKGSRRVQTEAKAAVMVQAVQPPLFMVNSKGEMTGVVTDVPSLTAQSSFDVARWWFRHYLEQTNRPKNTVASYLYDLAAFAEFAGPRTIDKITSSDVSGFLAINPKKSTRKRRLTSLGALFKYLIKVEKVADHDPTDHFYAEFVPLKTPIVLSGPEQEALMEAAQAENSRTYLMVYFLLKLGFTRTELLAVQPENVDISDTANPVVYAFYDDKRWQKKERKLTASPEFAPAFQKYVADFKPGKKLFEMLPQSVNKLVERVAREANINKKVTPQSLRDTFGVEESRSGSNSTRLLQIMGLAPDPRNRMSVERYIKLAFPPNRADPVINL